MLIRLNYTRPQPKDIQEIVDCLKNDGIIIYPTDTVYSMGCDMTRPKAIEKLCKLKGIKPEKANFSFVCSDLSHLSNYAKPNFESKHNSSYWEKKPYIGLGPSAHSYNLNARQWNVSSSKMYIDGIVKKEIPQQKKNLPPHNNLTNT